MRLWHIDLISVLPRQQLLGQHRECCAMRGNGWGQKHSVVSYVWEHPYETLVHYHFAVMREMKNRGYLPNVNWQAPRYRGKNRPLYPDWIPVTMEISNFRRYPEHNKDYERKCLKLIQQRVQAAPPGKYSEADIYRILSFSVDI